MKTAPPSYGKIALSLVALFFVAAVLTVCILPEDAGRLRYLVSGTLGSATMLAGAFGLYISGRLG